VAVFSRVGQPTAPEQGLDEGAQKPGRSAHEEAEVVVGGGGHGADAVAVASLELIAVKKERHPEGPALRAVAKDARHKHTLAIAG